MLGSLAVSTLPGCGEVEMRDPVDKDTSVPQQVVVREVKSFSGGATIFYDLPDDNRVKYVAARYYLSDGSCKETRASFFVDSVTVRGFALSAEYDIELRTVSHAEVSSPVQVVKVTPALPPYLVAAQSLQAMAIFGGVNLKMENPLESELEVQVIKEVDTGGVKMWEPVDKFVRSNRQIVCDVRPAAGIDAVATRFGILIKDRYNNTTDTLFRELTPLFERVLDKSRMSVYSYDGTNPLSGDVWIQHQSPTLNGPERLYDDVRGNSANVYFTKSNTGLPQGVSLDMGANTKLSRIVFWPRQNAESQYGHSFPKHLKIYGSNAPSPVGTVVDEQGRTVPDDSWTLLADLECVPPSGNTDIDKVTAADKEYLLANGHTYNIPIEAPAVRYIRIWTTGVWKEGNQFVIISEIDPYGDYVD